MKMKQFISVIVTTGSTRLNSHVRANCLWRCVNSMHVDPGMCFELILVDNADGDGVHREAIDEIWRTYNTTTHLVRNRQNEFHGGGVRQGIFLSDGDIIVQSADDLEYSPGWLAALVRPLMLRPDENWIGALAKGHNVSSKLISEPLAIGPDEYVIRDRAAAYCYAFHRRTVEECGTWRRAHMADTRWANIARARGYEWILPTATYARETNLNYLRPWDYRRDRRQWAAEEKASYLFDLWRGAPNALAAKPPHKPKIRYPLKNPVGEGPGCYSDDYLAIQERLKEEDLGR